MSEVSDHTSAVACLLVKQQLPRDTRPIPKWIAVRPVYQEQLTSLHRKADLEALTPFERLAARKKLIRQASSLETTRITAAPATSTPSPMQALRTACRSIWVKLSHLGAKLHETFPELQPVTIVDNAGAVELVQPQMFNDLVNQAMSKHFDEELLNAQKSTTSPTLRTNRIDTIQRWQKLWSTFGTKVCAMRCLKWPLFTSLRREVRP
jgi:hypothetical protein